MREIIFDALRWLEEPARVSILQNGEHPRVYFQITAPRNISGMCRGRPVEELPQILSILSPAHHLVSAMALDNLFGVQPPPVALNMRAALLQTLFIENHLKKFYSLLSFWVNPMPGPLSPAGVPQGPRSSPHILDDIMRHASISQEATTILGGRSDHPISAVAGGMSRPLNEEQVDRLSQIARSTLKFTSGLGDFLRKEILGTGNRLSDLSTLPFDPMFSMSFSDDDNAVVLRNGSGGEADRFLADMLFQKIDFHREPWSYVPFAYIKEQSGGASLKEQVGIEDLSHSQLFFVGPLARLNGDRVLSSHLAEEERQRLLMDTGSLPRFDVSAAYGFLLVELFQAAEKFVALCDKEKLVGESCRTLPAAMGHEGLAALESPGGLIFHHYKVDENGLLQTIDVLDPVAENNALRCILAQKTADAAMRMNLTTPEMKSTIEQVLLPI